MLRELKAAKGVLPELKAAKGVLPELKAAKRVLPELKAAKGVQSVGASVGLLKLYSKINRLCQEIGGLQRLSCQSVGTS